LSTVPTARRSAQRAGDEACRADGPGGQHVNKVSSAVRVHHLSSGIAIRGASARSQHANLAHVRHAGRAREQSRGRAMAP
jgi:protein subunit release factor B